MTIMIWAILAVLGLCLGSFINALVWRLHEQAKKRKPGGSDLSIIKGRSMCPHCKHLLAPRDLVPVLSWVMLRGKCRYCRKKFDDTPLAELLLPLLFCLSYLYWPFSFGSQGKFLFVFWLIFLVGLVALAIYDIRWYLLPDKLVYTLLGLAGIQTAVMATVFGASLLQAGLGLLVGGGLFYLLFQVSDGKWIGGGDVKLGAVLGLILADPQLSAVMIFVASLLGSLVSLPLIITGKASKGTHLPFGPFLIASTIIVYLFGGALLAWYRRQFLLG